MNLLRIITPEEIADIATKHNGGKFLSLTDLVNERVERNIHRDFTSTNSIDEIHDEHALQAEKVESAKILPFKMLPESKPVPIPQPTAEAPVFDQVPGGPKFTFQAIQTTQRVPDEHHEVVIEHRPDENMSSFILIEKERLKHSQKSLKKKEIISLYQKNSNIDLEQIKSSNQAAGDAGEAGVLINKKQY